MSGRAAAYRYSWSKSSSVSVFVVKGLSRGRRDSRRARLLGVCGERATFKYTPIEIRGRLERLATGEYLDDIVKGYRGRVSPDAIMEAAMLVTDQFVNLLPTLAPAS
jgi:hypothetical protein